jgi:hypothetical protein
LQRPDRHGRAFFVLSHRPCTGVRLARYKNYQSLLQFVPGATPPQFPSAVTVTPPGALTTNINRTNRLRNIVDGPGILNLGLRLFRDFRITERFRVRLCRLRAAFCVRNSGRKLST